MLGLQVQPVNIKFTEQGPTSLFRAFREPSCCLSKHNLAHVGAQVSRLIGPYEPRTTPNCCWH